MGHNAVKCLQCICFAATAFYSIVERNNTSHCETVNIKVVVLLYTDLKSELQRYRTLQVVMQNYYVNDGEKEKRLIIMLCVLF